LLSFASVLTPGGFSSEKRSRYENSRAPIGGESVGAYSFRQMRLLDKQGAADEDAYIAIAGIPTDDAYQRCEPINESLRTQRETGYSEPLLVK
jgi:hypothetical protein